MHQNLTTIYFLNNFSKNSNPAWLDMEKTVCKDLPIHHIAQTDKSIKSHNCFKYTTI